MTDQEKIAHLEARIADLEEKLSDALVLLAKKSVKKDSLNSGIPPSKDISRKKTQSLRKKSDKKTGGQPGHRGSNLKMAATPDEVEELKPSYCSNCGHAFEEQELSHQKSRQVFDIPLPRLTVKEYRQYVGRCSCGCKQAADFPLHVNAPVQYGKNLEALVGYLSVGQYIPYKRMTGLLSDVFSVNLSQGTVDNMLNRLGEKAERFYDRIREELSESGLPVGADETGCPVNGDNYWAWVWPPWQRQNEAYSYLTISDNRGSATVAEHFPEGFPNATLSSDRWAAHLKTAAVQHQICLVHLLRELNYLEALEKHSFAVRLRNLFQRAIHAKKQRQVFAYGSQESQKLEQSLDLLLKETIPKGKYPQTAKLQKSLIKLRQAVFPFLYEAKLSADNNASERSIRNIKVKIKVSGMFKSGHSIYARLKSVMETIQKKGQNIWQTFINLANAEYQWQYAE
jgi:transposase